MSEHQYATSAHHCTNAKNPTAIHSAVTPITVVKMGYVLDPDLSEIVGYRKAGIGLRSMGDISAEGRELDGLEIVRFEFNRSDELALLQVEGGVEIPSATGLTITLPNGANFTMSWSATHSAYVYPFPGGSKSFQYTGLAIPVGISIIT